MVEEISQLEPFGASNPSPIFETDNFIVKEKRQIGNEGAHLRLILTDGNSEFTALWWGHGETSLSVGDNTDIAYHPQINEFNGNISVQLIIDDIHSDALQEDISVQSNYKIYDNRFKTGILPEVNDYLKSTKLNVRVFAESKQVLDTIKPYDKIFSDIFTRENLEQCDVIMFFDYPADQKTFDEILEVAQPKCLHFMNYEPKVFDEKSLLKTFNGMVKFSSHNNNGKFELIRCSSYLGKSFDVVKSMLDLFERFNIIKINDKNDYYYNLEYLKDADLSEIYSSSEYEQIFEMSQECEIFQQMLAQENLQELIC